MGCVVHDACVQHILHHYEPRQIGKIQFYCFLILDSTYLECTLAKCIQLGRVSYLVSYAYSYNRFFIAVCKSNIQTVANCLKTRMALHRLGYFCCIDQRSLLSTL